ncbi:hypothetical protein CTI12_AA422130 [Artemisia annua]|uniref:Uncharacterized protein n=1 Tax=Artemisia annua TaxID=35608 RepID=A0A2U1M4I0_ARTAN|nr:hypothetical protein CTI12_AA422130 [Artemisia annua]
MDNTRHGDNAITYNTDMGMVVKRHTYQSFAYEAMTYRFLKTKPGFFDFWVCDQTRLTVESQIRLANNCHVRFLLMTPIVRFTTIDNQTRFSTVDLDQSRYSAVDNQSRCPAVVYQSR